MPRCTSCQKKYSGPTYRSITGRVVCRSCQNMVTGAVAGGASGLDTGGQLGMIHVLNTWKPGSRKERAQKESATTPLLRMPWHRRRTKGADGAPPPA